MFVLTYYHVFLEILWWCKKNIVLKDWFELWVQIMPCAPILGTYYDHLTFREGAYCHLRTDHVTFSDQGGYVEISVCTSTESLEKFKFIFKYQTPFLHPPFLAQILIVWMVPISQ